MSLKRTTLFVSGGVYICLLLIGFALSRLILLSNFVKLEKRFVQQDVEKVFNLISGKLESLNQTAQDWAFWDDTYAFIVNQNEAYIQSNLQIQTFQNLDIHLMIYINAAGQVVLNVAYDPEINSTFFPLASVNPYLPQIRAKTHSDPNGFSGFLMLPEGLLMVASQPILTSEGKGPSRGVFIIGRFLDETVAKQLSEELVVPLTVLPLNADSLPEDFRQAISSGDESVRTYIQPQNQHQIAGYGLIRDFTGKPALVLMIQEPRRVYQEGLSSVVYFTGSLIVMGIVLGIVHVILIHRFILTRIFAIRNFTAKVGSGEGESKRLQLKGKDELTDLARSINEMLFSLEQSEAALHKSEENYRTTVEYLNDLICRWRPDGSLTFVNEAYCRFAGEARETLIGEFFLSNVHKEDLEVTKAHLTMENIASQSEPLEYRIVDSSGNIHWLQWVNRPIYDESGSLHEILSIGRDITERKKMEEELRKNEAELRALFAAMHDVVIVYDRDGRYLQIAPTNASLLYKPADEMIGKTLHEVLPVKQADLILQSIHQTLDEKKTHSLDYNLNINNIEIWFSATISPLLDDTVILVAHDITNRKKMEEVMERQARELAALYATSLDINAQINLSSLLHSIVERATSLLDARIGVLYLLQPDGNTLRMVVSFNLPEEYQGISLQLGEGLSGRIAQTGKPLIVDDYSKWSGRVEPFARGPFRQVLGVPLKIKKRVIGVINISDDQRVGPFTEDEVGLLSLFADQAAIAIENARLFDEVQRLSITDELTGLNNRRHFFELAGKEFERACRYKHPLSAMMIDTDRFKQINDSLGHAVGDQVLQEIGHRFRDKLRKIDIVGRYGGDEFAILLPESDLESSLNIAERLRRCVADLPVNTIQGPLLVTISVGVAALSSDCQSLKKLLERADQAMYLAKQKGTNRVENWQSLSQEP